MQKQVVETEDSEEIDLREYINVLLKWKWMIILFTVASVLTGYIISKYYITPVYETKAVLMANQPEVKRVYRDDGSLESTVDSYSRTPELTLKTFVSQAKNAQILSNVIKKQNLEEKEYNVRTLENLIKVSGDPETNIIEVKVSNTDPVLVKVIANSFVEEMYKFLTASNKKQMKESAESLKSQLTQKEKELKEVKDIYHNYRSQERSHSVLNNDLENKTTILAQYKSQLPQNQVELEQLIAGKERIEETLANTPKNIIRQKTWQEDPMIAEMRQDSPWLDITSKVEVSEEMNPAYEELMQMLDQKNLAIAEKQAWIFEASKVVKELEYQITNLQVEVSAKQINEKRLERKIESLEEAYVLLNTKIIEAEISNSLDSGKTSLSVVSPAFQPSSPVGANKQKYMAIAAILGLMISVFLAFVLEFFDDTIKTPDDLKKYLDVPLLATIPNSKQ